MLEIFRDSARGFVGAIFGIIAIIISIIIFVKQKNKKQLSYSVLENNNLITASHEIINDVEIFYRKELVKNVSICLLKFVNNGNQPITNSDYVKPISVEFEEGIQVLKVNISATKPKNLEIPNGSNDNSVSFGLMLLNPNDSFEVTILYAGDRGDFSVKGRIVGVSEILEISGKRGFLRNYFLPVIFSLSAGLIIGMATQDSTKNTILGFLGILLIGSAILVAFWQTKRNKVYEK